MHADAGRLLTDFFEQLTVEKRASEHTVKSYQRDINHLTRYCTDKSILHWADLTQSDIRSHIVGRHRQGLGSISLQRELSAIRSFYNFLLKKRLADNNPAQYIKAPKQARKLPKTLDVDQVSGCWRRVQTQSWKFVTSPCLNYSILRGYALASWPHLI